MSLTAEAEALDAGAGDTVRDKDGSTDDDAPLVLVLAIEMCLTLGDAMLREPADGLMEPPPGAG